MELCDLSSSPRTGGRGSVGVAHPWHLPRVRAASWPAVSPGGASLSPGGDRGGKQGTHRGTTSWPATSWRRSGSDDMSDSEEELTPVKAFLFDLNVFLFDTQY